MSWDDIRAGNPVKQTLAAGGSSLGAFVRLGSVEAVEICGHAGCDFVIIDAEHSPIGWERTQAMIIAAEATGTVPILRVSNWTRDLITRGLDAGAHGIMVPQVETGEAAAQAVAATRYGPGGTRGTAGNRRATYGLRMPLAEYIAASNSSTLVVLQIESVAAVENVDAIAGVDGVDALLVGLTDLSVDLDEPGNWDHPTVAAYVDRVIAACEGRGIAFGVPVATSAMARDYLARGARFVAAGDTGLFSQSLTRFLEEVGPSNT